MSSISEQCHVFVDEAGDTTLFGRGGKVLVGTDACSQCFMLGLAVIAEPEAVDKKLAALRVDLLNDAYLKSIPSMQPKAGKTALYFHAKDDCPEVRKEVFKLVSTFDVAISVAIRRKQKLVDIGLQARKVGTKALLGANALYDDLVTKLFSKGQLNVANQHTITFARRGKKPRIQALANALEQARSHGKVIGFEKKPFSITAKMPSDCGGLQVIDYYLWALQRLYERHESRYFDFVKDKFAFVFDLDDTRNKQDGEWYCGDNQLTLEKIKAL